MDNAQNHLTSQQRTTIIHSFDRLTLRTNPIKRFPPKIGSKQTTHWAGNHLVVKSRSCWYYVMWWKNPLLEKRNSIPNRYYMHRQSFAIVWYVKYLSKVLKKEVDKSLDSRKVWVYYLPILQFCQYNYHLMSLAKCSE